MTKYLKKMLHKWRLFKAADNMLVLKHGDNLCISNGVLIYPAKHIEIGNNVFVGRNVTISTSKSGLSPIRIGNDVMIAERCCIIGGNHEISRTDIPMNRQGEGKQGPINIGNDVWIGAGVIIVTGITIGDGCVIGAGSVVTKNIPSYSIVAGNPARPLRSRVIINAPFTNN